MSYIIFIEKNDLMTPLHLPELKCAWTDILWEGVSKRGNRYHAVYLTNNEFALEFIIPDADWLPSNLRDNLEAALI